MNDSTATRLDFGVKTSSLITASHAFGIIGTTTVKTSKVLALAAILQGAPTEDVSKRTGIAEGTLKRIAALARNGVPAREGFKAFSVKAVTDRMRAIDWAALTNPEADWAAQYDAGIAAAALWDDAFVEPASKSRTKEPLTPTTLAILVHDSIVAAGDDAPLWAAAVNEALESAATALAELAAAADEGDRI